MNNKKRYKKAEKAVDEDEDDLVLCSIMTEIKAENVRKKVRFTQDFKSPLEADIMCAINRGIFFVFTKNTWIRGSGSSCHIMNDDASLFNVINIKDLIQGSSRNMLATKKTRFTSTSMDHKLFPQGRCKPVFSYMHILTEKENLSTNCDIILDC